MSVHKGGNGGAWRGGTRDLAMPNLGGGGRNLTACEIMENV
jgi:hypothetical protein